MPLPYRKLVVWQRADDLFVEVHRLTHKQFPGYERFEMGSQIRRAAFSVAANIVEGSAHENSPQGVRYLSIASASLAEVGYGLHAATRLGYLLPKVLDEFESRIKGVAAPLNGLRRTYRLRSKQSHEAP